MSGILHGLTAIAALIAFSFAFGGSEYSQVVATASGFGLMTATIGLIVESV